MAKFFDYLKNIFLLLILLQIAPTFIKSIKNQYSDILESKTKVAVIDIAGTLTNSSNYVKDLRKNFEDDDIKAIVLKLDCPGGVSGSSQAIFNEIKTLRCQNSNKYVIAFVENLAASGGYYIAAAANYIVTTPSAFIGSIGSYIAFPNFKELIEQYKIKYEIIKSGDYKTTGNPLAEITEEQRQMLQMLSDNVYNQFVKDIMEQRPQLPDDVKKWANGKIFTGEQAFKLGLIDELGSQSNVVKILKEKVHIKGKIEWVKSKKKDSLLHMIFGSDDDSDSDFFTSILSKIYNSFRHFSMKAQY